MENSYFTNEREQWLVSKKGKMTSSEIHKLFESGLRPMTPEELDARPKNERGTLLDKRVTVSTMFGKGAITYILSKISEMTSNEIEREINGGGMVKSMEWGTKYEPDAVAEFKKRTGLSVIYHGISCPKFYPYGDFCGGSPDGDVLVENAGLELKCPVDENVHTRRLLIKTVEQFMKEEFDAYCQCQSNMYIMKKDWWYFASYDPRKKDEQLRMKIVKLYPDIEWQKEFELRVEAATEIMAEILYETDKYLII